jgi:hypothetical protein
MHSLARYVLNLKYIFSIFNNNNNNNIYFNSIIYLFIYVLTQLPKAQL